MMKVIFFGTPLFSAHVLEYLLEQKIDIRAVISKSDRPQGRSSALVPTPVKTIALRYNLPVHQPEIVSDPEFAAILEAYQADLFIVVAYGEIIKQHLLDMPYQGCINLHTSLLPKYRGAAPIQRCIINGEHESGVTFIHMVKKMDAGNIIRQIAVPVGNMTTFGELENILCDVGKKELADLILSFEKQSCQGVPQDASRVTFAPKIELEDCEIDWNRSAQEIHNLIRGVNPYPGAWYTVTIHGKSLRLKVFQSRVVDAGLISDLLPGVIQPSKSAILIGTGEGILELVEVQLEGKKRMLAVDLFRGITF
jgi:methionyl-tRNA formyltransferase